VGVSKVLQKTWPRTFDPKPFNYVCVSTTETAGRLALVLDRSKGSRLTTASRLTVTYTQPTAMGTGKIRGRSVKLTNRNILAEFDAWICSSIRLSGLYLTLSWDNFSEQ
jgi:hypothetical protein